MIQGSPENVPYEPMELHRAESAADLRPAVEAAQYSHLIHHDEPADESEARSIRRFLAVFLECVESWETMAEPDKPDAIETVDSHLALLKETGFSVHWGTSEREFILPDKDSIRLPVAVLTIGRTDLPVKTVMLPREADVSADDPSSGGAPVQ